jgi:hypothetical protein
MKKIDKDPFSNGTEFMVWNEHNCDRCVKASHYNEKTEDYTKYRCAIQRDIDTRAYCNEPINERTVTICKAFTLYGERCPNLQTERKRRAKKIKEQLELL